MAEGRCEDVTLQRKRNPNLDKQERIGEQEWKDDFGGNRRVVRRRQTSGTTEGVRWAKWGDGGRRYDMPAADSRVNEKRVTHGKTEGSNPTGWEKVQKKSEITKDADNDYQPRKTKARKICLDFRKLTQLQNSDPLDILIAIAHPKSGLWECLNSDKLNEDFIKIFLRCIVKACNCQSAFSKKTYILDLVYSSTFINTTLSKFAICLLKKRSQGEREEFKQHITDIIRVVSEIARSCPISTASMYGVLGMLEMVMKSLRASSGMFDDDLWEQFEYCCQLRERMLNQVRSRYGENGFLGSFKDVSIFPEIYDIKTNKMPFLKKILKKGAFRNLEDYLDVHFRLLREDFIGPLRKGIHEYIAAVQQGNSNSYLDVRAYSDVKVLSTVGTNSGLCHKISFDVSRMKRVKWESSKRLLFGSLVCLFSDDFKTLLFATVAERDPKTLREGVICIKFEGISEMHFTLYFKKRFVMVEPVAYFEYYRHVLKGLQNINEGELPFENYIIQCNTKVLPPLYLRQNPDATFDLRCLVEEGVILKTLQETDQGTLHLTKHFSERAAFAKKINPNGFWPRPEQLHLDDSQYKALRRALTSEFVLIQGPPGTGKTYTALKIVKALLHNYKLWNRNPETQEIDNRPMLVVCRTNHALDQFLEGINSFFKGQILRLGGRSSSEVIKKYDLHPKREMLRSLGEMPSEIHHDKVGARFQMTELQTEIISLCNYLDIASREVLNERTLKPIMDRFYKDLTATQCNSVDNDFETNSFMSEWLGVGSLAHDNENGGCKGLSQRPFKDGSVIDWNAERISEDKKRNMEVQIDTKEEDDESRDSEETDTLLAQKKTEQCVEDGLSTQMQKSGQIIMQVTLTAMGNINVKIENLNKDYKEQKYLDNKNRKMTKRVKRQLKRRIIKKINFSDKMDEEELIKIDDIWSLSLRDRWRLYRLWVHNFTQTTVAEIQGKIKGYQNVYDYYKNTSLKEDKFVMEQAVVLGMTATCAAKYQPVLQEIGPRIIVAEEAASVLESQLITTLNKNCQQLILIGDHQQLRPNPTVYKLANEYNLEISLFERMIQIGIELNCLRLQHRMRPQISKYMTFIYPELQDNSVVTTYENVKGVSTNIFFINHDEPETSDEEMKTHSNVHEALYITGLCKYFLQQGYRPRQITVLTMYLGQVFLLGREMSGNMFKGVRITVVDNFQGEENDIILLSLVRHNPEGSIGFLKTDNRVCVALSRAKKGLYVIGNMDMMENGSTLWGNIIAHAYQEEIIGNGLRLVCENHPDEAGIIVSRPEDFSKIQECHRSMEICQFCLNFDENSNLIHENLEHRHEVVNRLDNCLSETPTSSDSNTALHVEPCKKILQNQTRTGSSGSFLERLHQHHLTPCRKTLICGHTRDDRLSRCPPCTKLCENHCYHRECLKSCSEPCVPCHERCEWSCQHYQCKKLCCEPCDRPRCDKPCTRLLDCNHECIGMCGEKCPSLCRTCDKDIVTEVFFGHENEPNARFIELEDCGHVFEVTAMDVYMDHRQTHEKNGIILKDCPKCKTSIRNNLRYGNQIKETLKNIEKVKQIVLENTVRVTELFQNISDKISELQPIDEALFKVQNKSIIDVIDVVKERKLDRLGISTLWEEVLIAIHNQAIFLKNLSSLTRMDIVQYNCLSSRMSGTGLENKQRISGCGS